MDHEKPGSIKYVVLKDPRDPDFVDRITSLTAEEPKRRSISSIQSTCIRFLNLTMKLTSSPTKYDKIKIEEFPKMRPIGKSDKAAEEFIFRELTELNKNA